VFVIYGLASEKNRDDDDDDSNSSSSSNNNNNNTEWYNFFLPSGQEYTFPIG
jgi:hypothetical protein